MAELLPFADIPGPQPERRWLPSEYQDEICPPPRGTPDAWIAVIDGKPALDENEEGEYDEMSPRWLTEGQVVKFEWLVDLGSSVIDRIGEDGIAVLQPPQPCRPPGANFYVALDGDPETATDSVKDLISECEVEEGDTIAFWAWSRVDIPFVFRDGGFHRVDETPASTSETE